MPDEMALLVADVFEAAGLLRRSGEAIAATEGQTQARWQLLSVVSEEPLTVAQAARRLGIARQGCSASPTISFVRTWPPSDPTPTTAARRS